MEPRGQIEYIRKKLDTAMNEVINTPLLMIIAPSGYGKSTLVRQYFAQRPKLCSVWVPLRREEADENWVWRRICNKLCEYDKELQDKISQIALPQSVQEMSYVVRIIRKYITQPVWLIVDDYQECRGIWMNRMLEELSKQSVNMHIILISRTYPDIPYEEMLLKGYCEIFNQKSLTLNEEETGEIFRINQIMLCKEELHRLYEYTDGWISAVYLSLYEYKKSGGFGSFLGVNHLLKTAIFDKLTPQMQEFYMKISLFDWFDIKGAVYVTQMQITESLLFENIAQFGFLHYDNSSQTFVMHGLLRSVAQAELAKSGIDISQLYDRAGEAASRRGAYIVAVGYYQKAGNWEKIAQLYASEDGRSLIEQAPEIFEEVRESIWEAIWDKHIMALLNHLYYLATHEQADRVWHLYRQVMEDIQTSEIWSKDSNLMGEMYVIRAILQFNDIFRMKESLRMACQELGFHTSRLMKNALLTYGTTCMTLLYYSRSGGLKETIELEKEYAKYYMDLTMGGQEGWDEFFDAEYAILTGDMEMAYRLAEKVCQQTILRRQSCITISCFYMISRCLIYLGKRQELEQKLKELKQQFEAETNPVLIMDMELVEGYIYACLGQKEKMPDWLRDFKLENCSRPMRNIRSGCMTYGKLLCAEKNWQMLDLVGDQMLVPYESTVHMHTRISGCIYKAIAKYNLGQENTAIDYFKEAVDLARPDCFRLPFLENGTLLRPVMEQTGMDTFLQEMDEQMKQYEKGIQAFIGETNQEKEQILTKREKELMGYVKAGRKNAEIAQQMHIAQVTVEKTLTGIYRKLGVSNRTAAILKMEDIGQKD